jgi:uncharacterized protein (DUF362 family)
MAKQVSNKVKVTIFVFIGLLVGVVVFVYQRLFGGEVQTIPEERFIGGPTQEQAPAAQLEEEKKVEKVAIAYANTPALGVQEVVARTGDLDFISPGQKVLVKPNVNSDDPAPGTTHPESLAEVVRLAKKKGANVIVADRSNPRWDTIPAMKKTGMYQAASDAGADEILGLEDGEWIRVRPEKAENWPKGFRIPKMLAEVDHIISVPVLHTHVITSHSLALKNLVGLIHPLDRMVFHASSNRDEMIAEISLAVKPSLTVIDGTKAFIDGGPSTGTLVHPKVYLAARDVLIADVFGVELLKKEGAKLFSDDPWESRQIVRAVELGISQLKKEEIQEELKKSLLSSS